MSPKRRSGFSGKLFWYFPQVVHSLVLGAVKLNSIFMSVCNIRAPGLRIFAYGIGNNLFPRNFAPILQAKTHRIIRYQPVRCWVLGWN